MTGSHVLVELVIVLGTAAVVTVVFQAVRLPVVLGYVLAGLLIGPHVPVPLVADAELVHILSELGVILLMFTVGLELPIATFRRVGVGAGLVALFEVGLVVALATLVAQLAGFPPQTAFFAGACMGISSTMLVAKAFEERGWTGGFTEVVFAILVFEDLIAIVLLAVLGGVASGSGLEASDLFGLIAKLAGFLAAVLVVGTLIVPRAIRWIAERARPETLLIAALALCFGIAVLAAWAGFSVALGAFVAGVLVAESGRGHDVFEAVRPFRDVFAMVFFVSVGMSIEPNALVAEAPRIGVFVVVVLAGKLFGVAAATVAAGRGVHTAVRSGLSLAQIGELSFVIAGLSGNASLLAIAVGVACVTTLLSPILIARSETIGERVAASLPQRLATFISFYEGWLARLRTREPSTWRELRKPIAVLVVDGAAVVAIAIAASRLDALPDVVRLAGGALLAAPFVFGLARRVAVIARRVALEIIPASTPVDLGRAPRRAIVVTFEVAIGIVVAVVVAAATQPFVPSAPILVPVVALIAFLVVRRRIADFEGHVRAGSELVLELIARANGWSGARASSARGRGEPSAPPLVQLANVLPGFEGVVSIALVPRSAAVGKSLGELDLRARTGATVLAIGRDGGGLATPSPSEPLRSGDVLALTGSQDAIAAARTLLDA